MTPKKKKTEAPSPKKKAAGPGTPAAAPKATAAKAARPKKAAKPVTKESRLLLLKNWKKRRLRLQMKAEKKLSIYIDRLVEKYPKDFLEKIKAGLEDETKFNEIVDELKFDMESSAAETDEEFLERFSRALGLSDE